MPIFERWAWIKRNWTYIIEEASKLNQCLSEETIKEYRRSPDIDFYDPCPKTIQTHTKRNALETWQRDGRKALQTKSRSQKAPYPCLPR